MKIPKECLAEMKAKDLKLVHGLLATADTIGLSQIVKCEDFSSLDRLLSVTALVLKFCQRLQSKVQPEAAASSYDENSKAEELWILKSQKFMMNNKNFKHWGKQFDLFQDNNGIWRCRGRIQNAAIPYSTKHPILLPKDHHRTTLFARKAHERVLHNGVKETLMELRSKLWMSRAGVSSKSFASV